jgi:hypothetical protein
MPQAIKTEGLPNLLEWGGLLFMSTFLVKMLVGILRPI